MREKDNLITKFRDAMGLAATHASPIGGYLSSKVRQGLNNAVFKPMEEKFRKDREQRQALRQALRESWMKKTDEEFRRALDKVDKRQKNFFDEMRPKIDAMLEYSTNSPGIHDPILYNSVVNPTPYPARTMPDVHQGAFSPLYRLQAQHMLRDKLRKDGYNPYIDKDFAEVEAALHKNHMAVHPLALF